MHKQYILIYGSICICSTDDPWISISSATDICSYRDLEVIWQSELLVERI